MSSINLNKRQQLGAQMLGAGVRPSVVAEKLNTSKETISRWQKNTLFVKAIKQAHLQILKEITSSTVSLADKAHSILEDLFDDQEYNKHLKASVAVRFLSMLGSQHNPYNKFQNKYDSLNDTKGETDEAFRWFLSVLDDLAELKRNSTNISDREYRVKANAIVNKVMEKD